MEVRGPSPRGSSPRGSPRYDYDTPNKYDDLRFDYNSPN